MAAEARNINWKYLGDSIPAFICMAVMPFSYSIAYGLIGGIMSYIVINTLVWLIEKASGGRIVPPNKEDKEPWTYKIEGGFFPGWAQRMAAGKRQFWRDDEEEQDPQLALDDGVMSTSNSFEKPFEPPVATTSRAQ
jgi:AGZA family xanthine/uracil permease-like MFS transporter